MFRLLSALSLCPWCVGCKYGSISHFKGVFSGFYVLDVGLYCLRALRGLWGFCVRERLGGFGACGVFAFLFVLCFISLPAFLLCLSSCLPCLFLCLCGLCCGFFFPIGLHAKRKGAKVCPLRPRLSLWVVLSTPLLRLELGNYCRRFRF